MNINVSDFTYEKTGVGKDTLVGNVENQCVEIFRFQFGFSIDKARNSGIADYLVRKNLVLMRRF